MASAKWETKSEYIFLVSTKLLPNLTNNEKYQILRNWSSPPNTFLQLFDHKTTICCIVYWIW